MYGYKDISNNGKYTYQRQGLLNFPYLKPSESTIIVERENANLVKSFLIKNKAEFSENLVILNEKEAKKFNLLHPPRWQDIIDDIKGNEDLMGLVNF